MGLITFFGINGVGKDSIANKLKEKNPDIRITSMSRLYMYILGITDTYETSEKVTEEQYKLLEDTPQDVMKRIEEEEYKKLLIELANQNEETILLSHLVSALRLGKETIYLEDRLTPKWLVDNSDLLIQLAVPPDTLSERRKADFSRKRETDINEIEKHQNMCFREWKRIQGENPTKSMYTIVNLDFGETVNAVEKVINMKEKRLFDKRREGEENER